jgi:pyruvate dehydrogenase E2 component (dihydrolipoamide acetyltransferase)
MEEATIGRWLVAEGAAVTAGQPIADLITDKVAYEYQSPEAGILLVRFPTEKSVIPVGTTLAVVGEPGEVVENMEEIMAANRRLAAARDASLSAMLDATATQVSTTTPAPSRSVRATPAARRLARERGVDLATLPGTGPDGMITVDDIP